MHTLQKSDCHPFRPRDRVVILSRDEHGTAIEITRLGAHVARDSAPESCLWVPAEDLAFPDASFIREPAADPSSLPWYFQPTFGRAFMTLIGILFALVVARNVGQHFGWWD